MAEERPGYKRVTEDMRKKAYSMRRNPDKICGAFAPTSEDGICRNWAGMRTDHPGTGKCWLHDKEEKVETVDLLDRSDEYDHDPDILELRGEIETIRKYIKAMEIMGEEEGVDIDGLVKLVESLRKLVSTKHQIEVQRNFLIPVTVAVNLARRISEIVSKYLPPEQRLALQGEVREALRIELALGKNSDPTRQLPGK